MNKLPCPACKKPLMWNGVAVSKDKFDTEGKRWYQYAGRRIYCKYCGTRLRNPHTTKLFVIIVAFSFINALVIQPLAKQHGSIVYIVLIAVVLICVAIFWSSYRYEKWENNKTTTKP